MRTLVAVGLFAVLGITSAAASDLVERPPHKQSVMKPVAVAPAAGSRPARILVREASDIPIIPLPKSLRPTRPPAGSPL